MNEENGALHFLRSLYLPFNNLLQSSKPIHSSKETEIRILIHYRKLTAGRTKPKRQYPKKLNLLSSHSEINNRTQHLGIRSMVSWLEGCVAPSRTKINK